MAQQCSTLCTLALTPSIAGNGLVGQGKFCGSMLCASRHKGLTRALEQPEKLSHIDLAAWMI